VVKTGCRWRQLPSNFPPLAFGASAVPFLARWRDVERVTGALRGQGRKATGRNVTPSVAIIDSQSAKTALKGGSADTTRQEDQGSQAPHRGRYAGQPAGGDRPLGRHPGPGRGTGGAMRLFCRLDTFTTIFVDGGYTGTFIDSAKEMFGYHVKVVQAAIRKASRSYPNAGS